MSTAIEFNTISKQYRLGLVSTKTLSHDLNRWWTVNVRGKEDPYLQIGSVNDRSTAADSDYVWALRDIDFKVEQGDVLGIIGKNGAGKSTLLKLLSRVTAPTTGTIRARGRIASLLEVGTGFHPEMTGRENIYMNGSIMGMTKREITARLDEIIDFAGVERYIDTPVKRYSSGMTVRLGFAIAAHLDPEFLVVDEVLAVGDAEFQKKAIGKMQDVSRGEGRTVLFVSHNMASIKQLCNNGVLLKNGTIDFTGKIDDVVNQYLQTEHQIGVDLKNRTDREGNGKFKYESVTFLSNKNTIIDSILSGDYLKIKIGYSISPDINFNDIIINIEIFDKNSARICNFMSYEVKSELIGEPNTMYLEIPKVMLKGGDYYIRLFSSYKNTAKENFLDSIYQASSFRVVAIDYWNIGRVMDDSNNAFFNAKYLL